MEIAMGELKSMVKVRRLRDGQLLEVVKFSGDRGTARGDFDLKDPVHYDRFETVDGVLLEGQNSSRNLVDAGSGEHYEFID
jgi:hypothetical protein